MRLRTNKFLRFFVTVLFLVEFLSPAFLTGSTSSLSELTTAHQLSPLTHPGFQLTLFSEQLNESEEERENYKSASIVAYLYSGLAYSTPKYTGQPDPFSDGSSLNLHSRPALFKLHCVFQI
jgi:hypothetical protein